MNKIISFIIPSYNVEKYLRKALDSFLLEDKQELCGVQEKIEIIVVDDGSKDGTADIAREYITRRPDLFRLMQKENGGHGSAINEGTRNAAGKYLKVIDADDWVVTENLPKYIRALEHTDVDVVMNSYFTEDAASGERIIHRLNVKNNGKKHSFASILKNETACYHGFTFHGITYRTDFYRQVGNHLIEKVFYEDHEYATIPCCFAETVMPLNMPLYVYRIGDSDQSVAMKNQLRRCNHLKAVLEKMIDFFNTYQKILKNERRTFYYRKLEALLNSYYKVLFLAEPDRRKGRKSAALENSYIKIAMPDFWKKTKAKYRIFLIMNYFHVSWELFEKIMNSSLYKRLHKRAVEQA